MMAYRIPFVLEKEPGGDFLALHGNELDLEILFMGKWVDVRGKIRFQSITAESIVEVPE